MDRRRCHLCRERSDDLETHLAEYHLKWFPFECARCLRRLPTDAAVRKHTAQEHVGLNAKFCYESEVDRKPQLDSLVAEANEWNSSQPRETSDRPSSADKAEAALNAVSLAPLTPQYQQPDLEGNDIMDSIKFEPSSPTAQDSPLVPIDVEMATAAAAAGISVSKMPRMASGKGTASVTGEVEIRSGSVGVRFVADSPAMKRRRLSRASPTLGQEKAQAGAIACKICADWKVDRLGIRSTDHVYMHLHNQLGEARFKCTTGGGCEFTTPHTAIIKQHGRRHVGQEFSYEDRESRILPQAERMHRQCFGEGLETSFAAHPSEVWCLLCKQGVVRNSISKHVYDNHMDGVAIYTCPSCAFGAPGWKTVRAHMQNSHPKARPKPTIQSDMYQEEIKAAYRRCFDLTVNEWPARRRSAPIGAPLSKVCKMCADVVETNRSQHVYRNHQDDLLFQCPACVYGSKYSMFSVTAHMSSVHGLDRTQLVDMRLQDECAGRLQKVFADCFYESERD